VAFSKRLVELDPIVCDLLMWASLAIAVVCGAARSAVRRGVRPRHPNSAGRTDSARIPSALVVALFAYLATRVVARYGFGRRRDDAE
jgi:hypothetical protein